LKQNDRIEAAQLLEGKKSILKFVQYSNKEIAYLQSAIFLKLFDACALNEIQEAYALICENLIGQISILIFLPNFLDFRKIRCIEVIE
jgi:hypothetical protein